MLEEFNALCEKVHSKLVVDGKWEPRKWKSHPDLRLEVDKFDLPNFDKLDEKLWAVRNRCTIRPTCVVCDRRVNLLDQIKGFRETCSVKCAANNPNTREKIAQTVIDKYGSHYTQNREWIDNFVAKQKEKGAYKQACKTLKEKYGISSVFEREDVKNKIKQTNLKKFGTENAMQAEIIKEKTKTTTLARHGAFFNPEKAKQTNLKKYGVENPMQSISVANKSREGRLLTYEQDHLANRLENIQLQVNTKPMFTDWLGCDYIYEWLHIDCGLKFKSNLVFGKLPMCPKCRTRSKPQYMIRKLLEDHNINFRENDRGVIAPKEIDFWVADRKLGIEVNGVYWHQDGRSTPLLAKTNEVEELGGQVLHFWDFEILERFHAVKNVVLSKPGLLPKIGARKLEVIQVEAKAAREFYDKNHLSGGARANLHLALSDGTKIVTSF